MDLFNGTLSGTDNTSMDITLVILILGLALGFGKDTGFNTSDVRSSAHHHKNRKSSCRSTGG
ncbi:hypothetical protein [Candidatus Clostridium stratigraminis]|uniref:Uncharacterized protein n=1 Tax=Candidatus Clostridium stratigraminis TaxID=3381661 RepID=A0ABW8T6T9_9CLOT